MKALLSQCMKYMPVACMKSLMLAHEGWEFDSPTARQIPFIELCTQTLRHAHVEPPMRPKDYAKNIPKQHKGIVFCVKIRSGV